MAEMQTVSNSSKEVKPLYSKKGNTLLAVQVMVSLIVGVGVATLVLIFVGTLGGQTFALAETTINTISNATVKDAIKAAAVNGFQALNTTSQYIPLIVLAVIIFVVLSMVVGLQNVGGGGSGGGSAL